MAAREIPDIAVGPIESSETIRFSSMNLALAVDEGYLGSLSAKLLDLDDVTAEL